MLRLLLTAAIPFQGLVDKTSPTHRFINHQALAILRADGKQQEATLLGRYLEPFDSGCDWADGGWRNIGHMYDPETGQGLRGWPSAPQLMREHWDLAVRYTAERNYPQAFFHLGVTAHLVQDLCVPHHAAARIFAGHKQFEAYARKHRQHFAVDGGGMYDLARTPEGWVIMNAGYTRSRYSNCIAPSPTRLDIHEAIADLLPRAQRTTAGLVAHFLKQAGVV